MIKAVMFDAIDTLFCPYPDKITQYQRVIEKHTGVWYDKETLSLKWDEVVSEAEAAAEKECGIGALTAWDNFNAKLLNKLGYDGDSISVGKLIKHETWDNPQNYVLYDDVVPALEALRRLGLKVACVSNEDSGLNNFFVHFNIKEYFDLIVISEEVHCEKPNPEIFNLAIERLGLSKDEVVFIGDSVISDYFGSSKAGLASFLIDRDNKNKDSGIKKLQNLTEIIKILEKEGDYASTAA